jgi:hypothetical protein
MTMSKIRRSTLSSDMQCTFILEDPFDSCHRSLYIPSEFLVMGRSIPSSGKNKSTLFHHASNWSRRRFYLLSKFRTWG